MRVIVYTYDKRSRPKLMTPAKGSDGDMVDETQADGCSVGAILRRYGGNVAEMLRWRKEPVYDTAPETNLEDAIEKVLDATVVASEYGYGDLASAVAAINDGTFGVPVVDTSKDNEVKNEEKQSEKQEEQKDIPPDGE